VYMECSPGWDGESFVCCCALLRSLTHSLGSREVLKQIWESSRTDQSAFRWKALNQPGAAIDI